MFRRLPEVIALPMLPLLMVQGKRTRRRTPRLPEAVGPAIGHAGRQFQGQPLSLLGLGESPIAGVGVTTYEQAITCQLAHAMAAQLNQPVGWRAVGKNGANLRAAIDTLVPQLPVQSADVVLLAFGVNDTTDFRPAPRYRAELHKIITTVQALLEPRLVVVAGVPPMPALPQPLRFVLGLKASALDAAAAHAAKAIPGALHIPMDTDVSDYSLMASDGYHPSASGAAAWTQQLVDRITPQLNVVSTKAA